MTKKIMIVDDEIDIIDILKTLLKREGYEVIESQSGKNCLEKIKKEKPDLVLMDIMMPDMDGWEVCKNIKEEPSTMGIPVSMLSIKTDEKDIKKSLEYAHANKHLTKPINLQEILSTIDGLLKKVSK